jgi:polar amino acid transport system permease protein
MTPAYNFQWSILADNWRLLVGSAWIDVWVSFLGFVLACILGLAVTLVRQADRAALTPLTFVYVQVARAIPPYVMLLWVHFGLATLLGLKLTPVQSVLTVLAFTGSGYAAEVFRAGILAVDRGQIEAAHSIGLTRFDVYREVILPQALRTVVPPLGNIAVSSLKTATLMSVIAVPDMLYHAQALSLEYFVPFEAFTLVLLIFVALVFAVSLFTVAIERALAHP